VSIVRYAQAQDCTDLKNETPLHLNELVATATSKLQSRSTKAVEDAEDALKKDMLVKLSEKIVIEVQSGSTNFVKDDGNALTQLFTSETKINSNTRLGNLKFEFCFDNKHKTLFGRCRLDKTGLAESIAKDCTTRLIALNAEIKGAKGSGNSVNVRPLMRTYDAITSDFQSALFINHQISTFDWNALVAAYNQAISEISNSDEHIDLQSSIDQANEWMAQDNYEEALTLLKTLNKKHKLNDDVEHAVELCYERYLAHIRVQASRLVQQHNYPGALELVDNYCASAICSSDAKELRTELRKGYFNEVTEMLTSAMREKDDDQAARSFNNLNSLADIKPDKANELTLRYKQYKVDRLIEKAKNEQDKRNYWEAYSLLRTTELTYGISTNELKSMKEDLFRKIAKQEIREEKKTRPHLNSFALGPETFSNEIQLSESGEFELSHVYLGFAAGVYFKYNFGPDNERKGYPVRSDLFGIKARYIDFPSYINIQETARSTVQTGQLIELGADGAFQRIFHYNVSAAYNQNSHIGKPMGMSASFGVRIPIASVALGADIRYFNKFNEYTAVNAVGYIQGYFDFNRKFNRADKRKVRARLKEY
jgi:hypothetical protein